MSTEQTYTLEEARKELDRQECRNHGHDYDVMTITEFGTMGEEPAHVFCSRCGKAWTIEKRDD